jgi:hypothetical protein
MFNKFFMVVLIAVLMLAVSPGLALADDPPGDGVAAGGGETPGGQVFVIGDGETAEVVQADTMVQALMAVIGVLLVIIGLLTWVIRQQSRGLENSLPASVSSLLDGMITAFGQFAKTTPTTLDDKTSAMLQDIKLALDARQSQVSASQTGTANGLLN